MDLESTINVYTILHTLLAVIKFCFCLDNYKQTMHDVKFNINNTSCH